MAVDQTAVEQFLRSLQDTICAQLELADAGARFQEERWQRPEGGGGISRVMSDGLVFEKAGVNFSIVRGSKLPPSASALRPDLVGAGFWAMGVSLVIHPLNPNVPTSHANVRFFVTEKPGTEPVWWFGGGYDLTPYYLFEEDCVHWHQIAKQACDQFGSNCYRDYKKWCDEYFFLPHRQEARGIGGLFFDDLNTGDFERDFGLMQAVGSSFTEAYLPIVERRKACHYGANERNFQLYRRGRYVEFNLVYDRGTLFGLQSNGRIESILMSLPPLVRFDYGYEPEPGSEEMALYRVLRQPRDWLASRTI